MKLLRFSTVVSAYKVILGADNITEVGIGTNAVRFGVRKIIKHERYVATSSTASRYDIALMKLDVDIC